MEKKLDIWKGNSLSSGGRTILINSSLSSTAVHNSSNGQGEKKVLLARRFYKEEISFSQVGQNLQK
jgi:hypothetical protein